MFFPLSKVLGFVALPSNLVMLVALLGVALLFTRRRRLGQGMMIASLLTLAIAGWSPLGNWLMAPLEDRFPAGRGAGAQDTVAGIIILGGAISPEVSGARGSLALNEAAERMTVAADLARRYPMARIVFSGGSGQLFGGAAEADFVLPLLESFGIARERITLEGRSRNTAENARFTKELVQPKAGERWLLVTSAYHMPRSIGVFRKEGFAVDPYPVDWRTAGAGDAIRPFAAMSAGLARTDAALHEWLGLLAYRLTGRTAKLLP
ncbi:MAG: hypothetical protein QOD94_555 [Alphaproteobacteria bacterium]|nr:hypothetical protein [Alphaproteobacteria bacterium]